MGEQAVAAGSPVRIPVNFWLKDQRVNGVLVAAHGTEKLVRYGSAGRLYVVTGVTPAKKHFTESTIPTFWRKVINGEDVDAESPAKSRKRRVARKGRGGEGEQSAFASLPADGQVGLKKASRVPASAPEALPPITPTAQGPAIVPAVQEPADTNNDRGGEGEMEKTGAKGPGAVDPAEGLGEVKQPKAARAAKGEKVRPAEPGQVKTDLPQKLSAQAGSQPAPAAEKKKRSAKEGAGKLAPAPVDSVQIVCPYCNHSESSPVSPEVLEKPFFNTCKGCGKAFAVRVVTKTVYLAEVAGFGAL